MKKLYITLLIALGMQMIVFAQGKKTFTPLSVDWKGTLKLDSAYANPLVDFNYNADPTAVEHNGRFYVYGTNDQQQCDEVHPDSANTYEHINSLVMLSTDDMVNWTFHGIIPTKKLAPWIIASWAPSICSRKEADGETHFYLYFSNSGYGTGVLTSTSPVGPWKSPLNASIVDQQTPGLGDCKVPFDPGVVIDDNGTGWLAFGAGKARIARLSPDMLHFDSPFAVIPAQHHFEANELNVLGGKLVYTYNVDWQPKDDWTLSDEKPSICSMTYMIPDNPLDSTTWHYQHYYLRNAGEDGFEYCNNHTHLHKYEGKWYLLYHTMELKRRNGIKGGYRNMCVEEIDVDEEKADIPLIRATLKGASQIHPLNPFAVQQIETTAGTKNVTFSETETPGNMLASVASSASSSDAPSTTGAVMVRGALFDKVAKRFQIKTIGEGQIDVRLDNPDGELLCTLSVAGDTMALHDAKIRKSPQGTHNICILFRGTTLKIDDWRFIGK